MNAPGARGFRAGDPLRALAALAVLVYHVGFVVVEKQGGAPAAVTGGDLREALGPLGLGAHAGAFGLYVFFVLSGYLLTRPFLERLLAGDRPGSVRRYARHRLLRLVPAFWVAALATLLYVGVAGVSWDEVVAVFLFAQTWDPSTLSGAIPQAWTLAVELSFYALLPLLALLAHRTLHGRPRPVVVRSVAVGLAVLFALSVTLRALGPQPDAFQRALPATLFAFVPGMGLALWAVRRAPGRRLADRGRAGMVLAAGLVALAAYSAAPEDRVALRALLLAVAAGGVVAGPLLAQHSAPGLWRPLDHPVLHWLGARSYGIYLWHYLVILVLYGAVSSLSPLPAFAVLLPAVIVASTGVAALSFGLIERPALARRDPRPRSAADVPAGLGTPAAAPSSAD